MEYLYSTTVDPSTYETQGLCDIPVRIHHRQVDEDLGAIQAREDWRACVGPSNSIHEQARSLGPRFNFLSVAFPEMLPDRMRILSYFNEFIFLHDDVVEAVDKEKGDKLNDEAKEICLESTIGDSITLNRKSGRKLMMSKISREILSIDPECGSKALALWVEWFDKGAGRENHIQFSTLSEYLEYRVLDVGKMYLTGVAIFAMGLSLSDSELELLSALCHSAWIALGLTNDLFSFPKELAAAKAAGESHVSNAIWVLMQQHSMDEDAAKQLSRQMIQENTAVFQDIVHTTLRDNNLSQDCRAFAEAIMYVISGNLVWTLGAPRYNPAISFNSRQLKWMEYGIPDPPGETYTTSHRWNMGKQRHGSSVYPSL